MRSDVHLALQLAAAAACVALRLTSLGWLFVIFFVLFPVATAGLVAQVVAAACTVRRGRIPTRLATLSGLTVAFLLGSSLLVTDGGDSDSSIHRPVDVLLGTHLGGWADTVGRLLAFAWFGSLLATVVVTVTSRPRPPRVPVPSHRHAVAHR